MRDVGIAPVRGNRTILALNDRFASSGLPRSQPVLHQGRLPRRDPRRPRLPVSDAERRRTRVAHDDPRLVPRLRRRACRQREVRSRRPIPGRRPAGLARARCHGPQHSRGVRRLRRVGEGLQSRVRRDRRRSTRRSCVYFGAHQSIGCKGITLFGTEEQKQKLSAALRDRRARRRVLSHRAGLRIRRAGDEDDGRR